MAAANPNSSNNMLAIEVDSAMQVINHARQQQDGAILCAYHVQEIKQAGAVIGIDPFVRYILDKNPSQQPTLHLKVPGGSLTTTKPCACGGAKQKSKGQNFCGYQMAFDAPLKSDKHATFRGIGSWVGAKEIVALQNVAEATGQMGPGVAAQEEDEVAG